jgi:hypothetical protein
MAIEFWENRLSLANTEHEQGVSHRYLINQSMLFLLKSRQIPMFIMLYDVVWFLYVIITKHYHFAMFFLCFSHVLHHSTSNFHKERSFPPPQTGAVTGRAAKLGP